MTTLGGVNSGYAILATGSDVTHTGGNETVANFGTVTGNVDLGAGTNAFNNNAGGMFNTGAVAFIGAGNVLTNAGTISPGALTNIFTTAVTGDFVQPAGGTYALDLDLFPNTTDRVNVTGTTSITGTVAINRYNVGKALPGDHQSTIWSSAGTVTNHVGLALDVLPSAVATYALGYPNANDIVLNYNINFQPAGLPPQLASIGNAINQIQTSRAFPGFDPIAAALFDLPGLSNLIQAYNALGGGGTAGTQLTAFAAGSQFTSALFDQGASWFSGIGDDSNGLSFAADSDGALQYAGERKKGYEAFARLGPAGAPVSQPDRWRTWLTGFGGRQTVSSDIAGGTPGLTQNTSGGAFGVDRQIARDTLIGFSVGGSTASFSVPERATSGTLDGAHVGIYGVLRRAQWYLSGTLSYGRFDNNIRRTITGVGPTENAYGRFNSTQLAVRVELGRRIDFDRFAVTPFTAVEFTNLWQKQYSENSVLLNGSPGILGLTYASQRIFSTPASLGVQFDSQHVLSNGVVFSPFVRAAWVHEFDPDRRVIPSFNVAPAFSFVTNGTHVASDLAKVSVGAKLMVTPQSTLFASFNGEYAKDSTAYMVTGGYRANW